MPPYELPTRTISDRSASSITPITSWICVSRSISRLSRCLRAPIPVKVGAYTSCPALRSLGISSRQTTLPAQLPCTRTNVAISSSSHHAHYPRRPYHDRRACMLQQNRPRSRAARRPLPERANTNQDWLGGNLGSDG